MLTIYTKAGNEVAFQGGTSELPNGTQRSVHFRAVERDSKLLVKRRVSVVDSDGGLIDDVVDTVGTFLADGVVGWSQLD